MVLIFKSRDSARLADYLKDHPKATLYNVIATAYFLEYKLLDRNEVQAVVDRHHATGYIPSYLSSYLARVQVAN